MRLKINLFLKNFGLRQASELQKPRLHAIKKLDFPLETCYHFLSDNTAVRGPNQADPLFNKLSGKVFIEHKTVLDQLDGNPRRTSLVPATLVNEFRRQNRFFKPLRKDAAVKLNNQNLAVFNYNMLNPLYKYMATFKAPWYRWSNNEYTFWTGVKEAVSRFPDWQQFIEIHLPTTLPTIAQFRMMSRTVTQETLETFNQSSALSLFDLYRFYGTERESSYLSQLPVSSYANINFLIRVQGSFFVINLGHLEDWRKTDEIQKEQETVSVESYIDELGMEQFFTPDVMQRKLISLFTTLVEYNNGNDDLVEGDPSERAHGIAELDEPTEVVEESESTDEEESPEVVEDERTEEIAVVDDTSAKPSAISKTFDLDFMEVTLTPPPESELEETTLVIDRDDIVPASMKEKVLKVEDGKLIKSVTPQFSSGDPLVDGVGRRAQRLYDVSMISPRTFEMAVDDAMRYQTMPDPFGSGLTVAEAMKVEDHHIELPKASLEDRSTIIDKSMLNEIHKPMMRKYNKEVLPKFILQSIMSVQLQGAAVTDIKVMEVEDAMNHYHDYVVTLKPVRGKASPVRFRLPVIDRDGRFKSNGVTYRQRLQKADIPIRKVKPTTVALTSYMNKTFVTRSDRAENNFDEWLNRQINARIRNPKDDTVTNVKYAELIQDSYTLPRVYTSLGKEFRSFDVGAYELYFKFDDHAEYFMKHYQFNTEQLEKNGYIVVGSHQQSPVLMDMNSVLYVVDNSNGGALEPVGTIIDLVGLNLSKAPLETILVTVSNKELPVGFLLGYYHGLTGMLDKLGVEYQVHQRGTRMTVAPDEYTLAFSDQILVFPRANYKAMLVVAGLKRYHASLRKFSRFDFDQKDVYYRIMEEAGLSARYLRVIDSLFDSWVDPVTFKILEEMKEPTDFEGLMYRSVDMLLNDWSPNEVDGSYMRYRGYERMAGTVFAHLNQAVRQFNNREGSAEQTISLDPHSVWRKIVQDPTVATIEDSNPIANIREQEAMTYRGDGGRAQVSMVARTRIYGQSDVGVISESTVDSGAVGVIAYLTPDANFKNMHGMTRQFDKSTDGTAKLLSTSALLGVCSTNDDPKRINFISIQQQQGIYADGYEVTPVRTGYEQVIAQRTSSIFAHAAEEDGEVIEVDSHGIKIKYKSGEVDAVQLGTIHGSAAGVNYPHDLVTDLKVGDKFKRGDTVSYNRKYFTPDHYTPGQVLWKAGVMARVVLSDNIDTLEDGSVMGESLARKLTTQTTDIKTITVRFDQSIKDLVKVGDHVDLSSILCIIEDSEMAGQSGVDDATLETLRRMSSHAPRAKVVGHVSKVECYYHGDTEDMSDGLRKVAAASDKQRADIAKALGKTPFTGEVDSNFRTKGQVLERNHMVIKIYIDHDILAGTGDKIVVANQMKSVVSRVMHGVNKCADGVDIDLIFGNTSIEERMVLSPKAIATTSILLQALSKHVAGIYKGTAHAKAK